MKRLRKIICILLVSATLLFPVMAAPTNLASGIDINLGAVVCLVATFDANLPVAADVPDGCTAQLEFDGKVIASAPFKNGMAPIKGIKGSDLAVAGTYEVVVYDGTEALGVKELPVVGYDPNIWVTRFFLSGVRIDTLECTGNIEFNVKIAPATGGFRVEAPVQVNSVEKSSTVDNILVLKTAIEKKRVGNILFYANNWYEGDIIVVRGVKFPELFPSYSFTFTISCSGRANGFSPRPLKDEFSLGDFDFLSAGMTVDEVRAVLGVPHFDIGSGFSRDVYCLDGERGVLLDYGMYRDQLYRADIMNPDGTRTELPI